MEAANDLMTEEILQGDIDNGQEAKQKRLQSEGVEKQETLGRRPPKGDVAGTERNSQVMFKKLMKSEAEAGSWKRSEPFVP